MLADGQRCEVADTVRLHVKLLSFSWDHEFKVLRGRTFPAILGLDFCDIRKCWWTSPLGNSVLDLLRVVVGPFY
jgi:hypothetical protein